MIKRSSNDKGGIQSDQIPSLLFDFYCLLAVEEQFNKEPIRQVYDSMKKQLKRRRSHDPQQNSWNTH